MSKIEPPHAQETSCRQAQTRAYARTKAPKGPEHERRVARRIPLDGAKLLEPVGVPPKVGRAHRLVDARERQLNVCRAERCVGVLLCELADLVVLEPLDGAAHRHHGRLAAQVGHVRGGVSDQPVRQRVEVDRLLQLDGPQVDPEQHLDVRRLGQRDVDALLEPALERLVQVPREVGGRQHHHVLPLGALLRLVAAHPVHLHQQLRLDAARGLVLARGAALRGERVDLVDKDSRRRVEARHVEEQTDHALRVASVL
eukprot:scaffold13606_cov118-Isochrysis_galbana.AAC.7